MRIVLDTSVLIAAVRSSTGASSKLLQMGLLGEIQMLMSVPLLIEYESVLVRPEQLAVSGFSLSQIDELLEIIRERSTLVHLGFFWPVRARDEDDSHVLTLAVIGHADALVTHNLRDFAAAAHEARINLYTPADVLVRLRS